MQDFLASLPRSELYKATDIFLCKDFAATKPARLVIHKS